MVLAVEHPTPQSGGVMVAQLILVQLVGVRVPAGLPIQKQVLAVSIPRNIQRVQFCPCDQHPINVTHGLF